MNTEILDKIIQDGSSIKTQIAFSGWESSIIISHSEDVIQINLVPEYYKIAAMTGDTIKCKYFFGGKEYLFEGEIQRVTIYGIPSMFIMVRNIETFRNKRESERLDVRLGANLKLQGENSSIYCIIDNISENGFGILSKIELRIGDKVTLDVLIDCSKMLTVKGKVVRQKRFNEYHEIGIEVSKEDISGLNDLKDCVYRYEQSNFKLAEEILDKISKNENSAEKIHTVLIVDHNDTTRLITKKLLLSQGYLKIIEATDGPQAVSLAEKLRPEIIILDILLPSLSGTELIDELYNVSTFSKIIVITTITNRKIIEDVKAEGIIDYLIKPFEAKQLIEALNKIS